MRFHCPNGLVVLNPIAKGGHWWAKPSPNKPPRPQFEILNTTNQLSLSNFKMSTPLHKHKASLLKTFWRRLWWYCAFS